MQAILTKVLPCTNTKPTRIKATCARGSLTISAPVEFAVSDERAHRHAAQKLCEIFWEEDALRYGSNRQTNPWAGHRAIGCLPNGDFCHVFVEGGAK